MLSINVNIPTQKMVLMDKTRVLETFLVSTALKGPGNEKDSGKTPTGRHIIRAKIGQGAPLGAVFVGRRPTQEIYTPTLAAQHPERDWILTRILWLSGCEKNKNRLGNFDTMQRYIYIHGCPDTEPMGVPKSHGCIRMRNCDIVRLFESVPVGTQVLIEA